jgi:hypothetical protein
MDRDILGNGHDYDSHSSTELRNEQVAVQRATIQDLEQKLKEARGMFVWTRHQRDTAWADAARLARENESLKEVVTILLAFLQAAPTTGMKGRWEHPEAKNDDKA